MSTTPRRGEPRDGEGCSRQCGDVTCNVISIASVALYGLVIVLAILTGIVAYASFKAGYCPAFNPRLSTEKAKPAPPGGPIHAVPLSKRAADAPPGLFDAGMALGCLVLHWTLLIATFIALLPCIIACGGAPGMALNMI